MLSRRFPGLANIACIFSSFAGSVLLAAYCTTKSKELPFSVYVPSVCIKIRLFC